MSNLKRCVRCRQYKSKDKFHVDNSTTDGLLIYCRDCIAKIKHEQYLKHKDAILKQQEIYYLENKIKCLNYCRNNRKRIRQYEREKYKNDPTYRISRLFRNQLRKALKKQQTIKSSSVLKLVDCSLTELRQHLQNQFQPGMSWQNHGAWEIDHIQPLSSFDLTQSSEQQKAFHFTNLQPLWQKENRSKHAKVIR